MQDSGEDSRPVTGVMGGVVGADRVKLARKAVFHVTGTEHSGENVARLNVLGDFQGTAETSHSHDETWTVQCIGFSRPQTMTSLQSRVISATGTNTADVTLNLAPDGTYTLRIGDQDRPMAQVSGQQKSTEYSLSKGSCNDNRDHEDSNRSEGTASLSWASLLEEGTAVTEDGVTTFRGGRSVQLPLSAYGVKNASRTISCDLTRIQVE